jgi:hypothetical protein
LPQALERPAPGPQQGCGFGAAEDARQLLIVEAKDDGQPQELARPRPERLYQAADVCQRIARLLAAWCGASEALELCRLLGTQRSGG